MSIIWDVTSAVESNVVEVTMMNLRKKIESVHSILKISSRRNVGYWVDA
jgi:DNA-binding response OmpR family regulator